MKNDSAQPANAAFFHQLDLCCKKVAEKVGDKEIVEWKNSDYIKLSQKLYRQTKVTLSEDTLKRVFGKLKTSTRYFPQKATRDALAQFIGYRDWYEFELMNPLPIEKPAATETHQPEITLSPELTPRKRVYVLGSLFLFVTLLCCGFYFFYSELSSSNSIGLVCINPEGHTPHSAIFKLNIQNKQTIVPKDLFIDFGDLKQKKNISGAQTINHYYELPGRFYPKLVQNGKILDTSFVYLKTNGWTIIPRHQNDTTRFYAIRPNNHVQNGVFTVSASEVAKARIDTNETFTVSFFNIKPTQISADNFELNADIKASAIRPGVTCSEVAVNILGELDYHSIKLVKPECAVWAYYSFSEDKQDGETSDLRSLGLDISKGAAFTLRIENKKVMIYINKRLIFTTQYKNPIGKVMGIRLLFTGLGQFSNFQLKDLKTGQTF